MVLYKLDKPGPASNRMKFPKNKKCREGDSQGELLGDEDVQSIIELKKAILGMALKCGDFIKGRKRNGKYGRK